MDFSFYRDKNILYNEGGFMFKFIMGVVSTFAFLFYTSKVYDMGIEKGMNETKKEKTVQKSKPVKKEKEAK